MYSEMVVGVVVYIGPLFVGLLLLHAYVESRHHKSSVVFELWVIWRTFVMRFRA